MTRDAQQTREPFALFGHSMGALICFELARLLREQHGVSPARLFVSAVRAPHIADPEPPNHVLPKDEFKAKLRGLNGTPREILDNTELMELVLPTLRADFAVCETYGHAPGPPLDCPISAFGGVGDQAVPREDLEGWRQHTTAAFSLTMFPGDHFFLHNVEPLLLQMIADACAEEGNTGPAPEEC